MSDDKFDVIIVGAGPAGTSAAITAARAGLNVVVLERGAYPGAKNVQGAVLYGKMLAEIVPEFWKDPTCPLERYISQENIYITTEDSAFRMGYFTEKWTKEPYNAYTIIRVNFDKWYSKKAEEAGAQVFTGVTVSKLLQDGKKVIGIETSEGDQLLADCVIACDGVNSMLAQSIGLMDEWKPNEVALGVKEVLSLPRQRIQDRFNLEGDEGATVEMVGKITQGMLGYVFLYTNKDSLSYGVGCRVADFQKSGMKPYDLLEMTKTHPVVKRLLADAKPLEYSAHLIPEGGFNSMPPLYADGFLVGGDAAQMINPAHREGSNLAMTAGRLAAETVIEAKKKGDFSKETLKLYQEKLRKSFVLGDLEAIKDLESSIESRPDILNLYPELVSQAFYDYFTVDGRPKKEVHKGIFKKILKAKSPLSLLADLWALRKAL